MRILIGMFGIVFLAGTALAQEPDALPAKTLAGTAWVVPDGLPAAPSVLVVGFTRSSGAQTSAWSKRIAADPALKNAVARFSVAILEDVPSLLRGFVVSGIKRDVPEAMRSRFLIATEHSDAWKQLVAYAEPESAYVALFDARHQLVWRGHGELTEAAFEALQAASAALARQP